MTVADIDTAAFRRWYDSGCRTGREIEPPQVVRDVFDLCDEIDRLRREWDTLVNERADLRARLAEVEAERDGGYKHIRRAEGDYWDERHRHMQTMKRAEAAEARLAAALALAASWIEEGATCDDLALAERGDELRAAAAGDQ